MQPSIICSYLQNHTELGQKCCICCLVGWISSLVNSIHLQKEGILEMNQDGLLLWQWNWSHYNRRAGWTKKQLYYQKTWSTKCLAQADKNVFKLCPISTQILLQAVLSDFMRPLNLLSLAQNPFYVIVLLSPLLFKYMLDCLRYWHISSNQTIPQISQL